MPEATIGKASSPFLGKANANSELPSHPQRAHYTSSHALSAVPVSEPSLHRGIACTSSML